MFRDVSGAGLEICGPVYQVKGVELPVGMPNAPIKIFVLTGPAVVQIAAERWVQFEPVGWHDMQAANAALIVEAVNSHAALKEEIARLREALRPFVAKMQAVEDKYRKRGGNPDGFPDNHPSFGIAADELRMGVWRAARSAISEEAK